MYEKGGATNHFLDMIERCSVKALQIQETLFAEALTCPVMKLSGGYG
jgi:hypothetical protein